MLEFVSNGGQTLGNSKALYVKNAPIIVQNSLSVGLDEDKYKGLTPKERMILKKEEETKRKMEELANAAKNAKSNYQKAEEMKFN